MRKEAATSRRQDGRIWSRMATRNRIAIVPRASADFGIYGLVSAVGEGEGAPENAVVGEGGGNDVDGGAGPGGDLAGHFFA